ncbi:hypothetical protein [Celerinatantimonas yamalensis]|uniref:Uncharacterized protein n=1 Tax=Celerinatantimonas yamalensis TaxID=559956 RepID=A0ABW9GAN5_9GAMM
MSSYGPNAYNSQTIAPQPPAKAKRRLLSKLLSAGQAALPFHRTHQQIPQSLWEDMTPERWREMEQRHDGDFQYNWNEQFIQIYVPQLWGRLYLFLAALAKVIVIYFTFFFIITQCISFPLSDYDVPFLIHSSVLYLEWIFLPCALIWAQFELSTNFRTNLWFLRPRLLFEFNRQTGMVTLYRPGRLVRFSHPFVEFDCVLTSAPTQLGFMRYGLMLVHRYQGYRRGIPAALLLTKLSEPRDEMLRLWNFIQCYMDVSQPLPDILALEAGRLNDPTTAKVDKKTGRTPRYWRDMDEATFAQTIRQTVRTYPDPMMGETIPVVADRESC